MSGESDAALLNDILCADGTEEPQEPGEGASNKTCEKLSVQTVRRRLGDWIAALSIVQLVLTLVRWIRHDGRRAWALLPATVPLVLFLVAFGFYHSDKERELLAECYNRYTGCMHRLAATQTGTHAEMKNVMISRRDFMATSMKSHLITNYELRGSDSWASECSHRHRHLKSFTEMRSMYPSEAYHDEAPRHDVPWYCTCVQELATKRCIRQSNYGDVWNLKSKIRRQRKKVKIILYVALGLLPLSTVLAGCISILLPRRPQWGHQKLKDPAEASQSDAEHQRRCTSDHISPGTSSWAVKVGGVTLLELQHRHAGNRSPPPSQLSQPSHHVADPTYHTLHPQTGGPSQEALRDAAE